MVIKVGACGGRSQVMQLHRGCDFSEQFLIRISTSFEIVKGHLLRQVGRVFWSMIPISTDKYRSLTSSKPPCCGNHSVRDHPDRGDIRDGKVDQRTIIDRSRFLRKHFELISSRLTGATAQQVDMTPPLSTKNIVVQTDVSIVSNPPIFATVARVMGSSVPSPIAPRPLRNMLRRPSLRCTIQQSLRGIGDHNTSDADDGTSGAARASPPPKSQATRSRLWHRLLLRWPRKRLTWTT